MEDNMSFFDGLYPYEIVMLLCGVLLFLVLVGGLIVYFVRGKALTGLLIAFAIPIVMMGFPGISSMSYNNARLDLKRQIAKVQEDPKDPAAREELEKTTAKIEEREASNPQTLTDLSQAQFILGDQEKAKS